MANPQLENGHLRLANEIIEALMRTNLSAYQMRILWAIWRKTYAWRKPEDWISNSQLISMTGLRKQHVSRAKKELFERQIVTKSGYKMGFNKDYTQWRELPKQVTTPKTYPKLVTGVTSTGGYKNKYTKTKVFSSDILQLSDLLAQRILSNNPKHTRLANGQYDVCVKRWAADIERLHRLDKQSIEDIRGVIEWCQSDTFWKGNILSGASLRRQWDTLYIKSQAKKPGAEDWR